MKQMVGIGKIRRHFDLIYFSEEQLQLSEDELVDNVPLRGTRSLKDDYQRCNLVTSEPTSYAEAQDSQAWRRAMQEELDMIEKNGTWQLVDRPRNRKVIGVKWIFKTKLNPNGAIFKPKARLVVKGYT